MNRDRVIQLVATLVAACCLTGAAILVPAINRQRVVEGPIDATSVHAKYAVTAAALGTFRGLVADIAWIRAEKLKQAGKHYEANSLAQWITTLQPRFPQVWGFQAWNLAYNISVQTHTPEERWDWVNKGVRLLREEGIPLNPTATGLYKELGWIFFHKIGKYSDDMHWTYKRRLAREWQLVLGAPTEGLTTRQTVDAFRPIAEAASRYFIFDRLSDEALLWIDGAVAAGDPYADELADLRDLNRARASEVLADIEKRAAAQSPAEAERLAPLRALLDKQAARRQRDKLSMLLEDAPEAAPLIEQLREMDLGLDKTTLERIGHLQMILRYRGEQWVLRWTEGRPDKTDHRLVELLLDESYEQAWPALLAYLRAQVLTGHYHMDAGVMLELMELFGPIDWRHPAAHGIYWSFLGVRKAGELRDPTKIDLLNTDRQVIHGLQELRDFGRVSYDPFYDQVDLQPDPRFIPAYDRAIDLSLERMADAEFGQKRTTIESFQAGHENFLLRAVALYYLYGDKEDAEKYFIKSKMLYQDLPHAVNDGRYNLSVRDLVMKELAADMSMSALSRAYIQTMLVNAFKQGLALRRLDVYERYKDIAERAQQKYQEDKAVNPTAEQDRMLFLPFERLLDETFITYMQDPQQSLLTRQRVYTNAPPDLKKRTYARFAQVIGRHCRDVGFDPDRAFPAPEDYDQHEEPVEAAPEDPGTVDTF